MAELTLKEKTAKGLLWGGMNGGIQQILNVVFGVVLARILNAEDYGLVGMLAIFTGIAGVLIDSGFTVALINREKIQHDDYNSVFWFSLLVGIVCYAVLFWCAPLIAAFYKRPELVNLSRVLFLCFLIGSAGMAPSAMLTKKMMFRERAVVNTCAMIASGVVGIILASKGFAYWGIAIQTVTYISMNAVMCCFYAGWHPTFTFKFAPLKEMYTFGVKVFLTNVFSQINGNVFSVLLGRFYKAEQVGYYTQGNKWMGIGCSFVWSVVSGVSLPVLAEVAGDKERQRKVFRKMLRFVSFLSFPSMLGLALVSRELVVIGVSGKWLPCVPILQMLCVWGAITPVSYLYANVLLSRGKSNLYLYGTVCQGLVQWGVLLGMLSRGIYYMVSVFVVVNILWLFVWHVLANRCIALRLRDMLKDIMPFGLIAAAVMGATYWVTKPVENMYLLFAAKIVVAALLYGCCMYFSNARIFKEFVGYLLKRI